MGYKARLFGEESPKKETFLGRLARVLKSVSVRVLLEKQNQ